MSRTEAQNRATYKYAKEHLKRVPLDLQLSDYEELKQAASAAGMSINGFVKAAIKAAILTADPVRATGADPVQVAPIPVGDSDGAGVGRVTPVSTEK